MVKDNNVKNHIMVCSTVVMAIATVVMAVVTYCSWKSTSDALELERYKEKNRIISLQVDALDKFFYENIDTFLINIDSDERPIDRKEIHCSINNSFRTEECVKRYYIDIFMFMNRLSSADFVDMKEYEYKKKFSTFTSQLDNVKRFVSNLNSDFSSDNYSNEFIRSYKEFYFSIDKLCIDFQKVKEDVSFFDPEGCYNSISKEKYGNMYEKFMSLKKASYEVTKSYQLKRNHLLEQLKAL